ncbi:MAG: glutathione S-transferase family protein [Arenicellales bacterium]|nr:glutathione S-transferase family protein [Arenicellales bacterium]
MIRLYDFWESGNAYKVRLLLSQLGIPFERVNIDILKGETRTERFLQKNPNHRVPLVEWPDGRILTESNAILFFFAQGTDYLSEDPWQRAQTLQWMFFEQYSHEPYIAVVRFWTFSGQLESNKQFLAEKMDRGHDALRVMETHLENNDFFVGNCYSITDIALYAYTHVAGEGGFDLGDYAAINRWLDRVRNQPGHRTITDDVGVVVDW